MERSAGILLYRAGSSGGPTQVLLGHMGGPYWAAKDDGAWSIPKGLVDASDHDEFAAAQREFVEEMGVPVPAGTAHDLGVFRQRAGKEIHIWTLAGDLDPRQCSSNTFTMEWPPRSGRHQQFPELDRAAWWSIDDALVKVVRGQQPVLEALRAHLSRQI